MVGVEGCESATVGQIFIYFGKQQLLLTRINHVIYFSQSELLLAKTNEDRTTSRNALYSKVSEGYCEVGARKAFEGRGRVGQSRLRIVRSESVR